MGIRPPFGGFPSPAERVGNSVFEFSMLSHGVAFPPRPLGAFGAQRRGTFLATPFLRIDLPRISIRWALCTSRSKMLSASVGPPICSCSLGHRELAGQDCRAPPAKQRRLAQNIYAGHSTMVSVFGPGTRGVGIGMLVPRCLSHWHSCRCSILSRPPVDSCKRDVRI